MDAMRIFCEDLDAACLVLKAAMCEFTLDRGYRILSNNLEDCVDALEDAGIDFVCY